MFTPDRELCRNFSAPYCGKNDLGDVVEYTHSIQRPKWNKRFEYVFCSTADSYLSTVIDWKAAHYTEDEEGGDDNEGGDGSIGGGGGNPEDDNNPDDSSPCGDSGRKISIDDLEKRFIGSEDEGIDLSELEEEQNE
ncbi:unnamed protein product [Schistocephalus solidus]|uniref:C2H2-type domain-containing protein n=1 Tax=Schistocephalus solidus TaxID=70667 RepID=A0A183TJH7_SCHSO|nr:unnamed protein product [Schistocephalus solidus]